MVNVKFVKLVVILMFPGLFLLMVQLGRKYLKVLLLRRNW